MMSCRELLEVLLDLVSGELSQDQIQRCEQHLSKCPPCVVFLHTYRLTVQLARQLPTSPLPPPCENRLRTAVSEQWKQQWSNTV
jgi:anti-sigma factor RsiW